MPLKSPKDGQRNFPNFNEQEISKKRMQYVKEKALTIDKLSTNIVYDSEIKELIYVNMILFIIILLTNMILSKRMRMLYIDNSYQ